MYRALALPLAALALATPALSQCHRIQLVRPGTPPSGTYFGHSVAIDGDLVLVGSLGSGKATIVRLFDAGSGALRGKLKPPAGQHPEGFGRSIALDGPLAVVGADGGSGELHLFTVPDCTWRGKLVVPGLTDDSRFGTSVAISGSRIVAGAWNHGVRGAAYLFDTATSSAPIELIPSQKDIGGAFGYSVAIDDRWIVVGAPHDLADYRNGAAYVFDAATGDELRRLTPSQPFTPKYGGAVSIDSGRVLIGGDSAETYLYDLTSGKELACLGHLGLHPSCVGISGNRALLGGSDRVVVFDLTTGERISRITAPKPESTGFGYSLAVDGRRLVVGAPWWHDVGGAAFLMDLCDPIGTNYCGPAVPNASGKPAEIAAHGSEQVSYGDLLLIATDMPFLRFGWFLASTTQGFVQNPPGSAGNLCLGGSIVRRLGGVKQTNKHGSFIEQVDLIELGAQAGETWNFQAWFNDGPIPPPLTGNFTDGVSVVFR